MHRDKPKALMIHFVNLLIHVVGPIPALHRSTLKISSKTLRARLGCRSFGGEDCTDHTRDGDKVNAALSALPACVLIAVTGATTSSMPLASLLSRAQYQSAKPLVATSSPCAVSDKLTGGSRC
jgi:hypothetical protein